MNRQRVTVILPFVVWLALLPSLWLSLVLTGIAYYLMLCVTVVHEIIVPMLIVRFVEKQRVSQRFGFQRSRVFVFFSLIGMSALAMYLTMNVDVAAVSNMVLAPISEEIFFRGYVLGRFRSNNAFENVTSTLKFMCFVVISSIVFTFSHVFTGYTFQDIFITLPFGIAAGVLYGFTGTVLFSTVLHADLNYSGTLREKHLPLPQFFGFWIALMTIPSFLLFVYESTNGFIRRGNKKWKFHWLHRSLEVITSNKS